MSGLSREILKWLQSLDLSYSVKNVKRDFSNGFLVAEILCRFFPEDISMHSYDNGSSLTRKLDNWKQLEKVFARRGMVIDRHLIDDTINAKNNGAVLMIETVYTTLTNRTVQVVRPVAGNEVIPPFARETASSLVKQSLKESDVAAPDATLKAQQEKASLAISEHNQTLRSEKANDPYGRFNVSRSNRRNVKGPPKPAAQIAQDSPGIQFQEVQVKQLDVDVTSMRQMAVDKASSLRDSTKSVDRSERSRASDRGGAGEAIKVQAVFDILAPSVAQKLSGTQVSKMLDPRKEKVVTFLESLGQISKSDADPSGTVVSGVFHDFESKAAEVSDSLVLSPKEFVKLFNLFANALSEVSERSFVFGIVTNTLCRIGEEMVNKDGLATVSLLCEFGLPRLTSIILSCPAKRADLMAILYAFTPQTVADHIKVIKQLQDAVDDLAVFVACLPGLIRLEESFPEDLLDLYIYYAIVGLNLPAPSVRATSLSMIAVICEQSAEVAISMLDRFYLLTEDPWWETRAQLLVICASALKQIGPDGEGVGKVYDIVKAIFDTKNTPNISKVGLSVLAPYLKEHPTIASLYVQAFMSLPDKLRTTLTTEPHIEIWGTSACKYNLQPLVTTWDGLSVAKALVELVKQTNLDNLEREHVDVMVAALQPTFEEGTEVEWMELFLDLKDYLYVALCDEDVCGQAIKALRQLLLRLGEEGVKTFDIFFQTLRMLYTPEGSTACQEAVVQFIKDLKQGAPFLQSALSSMLKNLPPELKSYPIAEVM